MSSSTSAGSASEAWLLDRYHRLGDTHAREALVAQMMPLVRRISRAYRSHAHQEDLEQVAAVGLIKAIERFDPARGGDLRRYAIPTMLGELRRYLRDSSWLVRPPRPVQERVLNVTKARDLLTGALAHAPTAIELADETGYDLDEVVEALTAGATAYDGVSLDAPLKADGETWALGDALGAEDDDIARTEERDLVGRLGAGLDERARHMLALRYVEDLTQLEIAQEMGCSQMQVSRVLRKALDEMQLAAAA